MATGGENVMWVSVCCTLEGQLHGHQGIDPGSIPGRPKGEQAQRGEGGTERRTGREAPKGRRGKGKQGRGREGKRRPGVDGQPGVDQRQGEGGRRLDDLLLKLDNLAKLW